VQDLAVLTPPLLMCAAVLFAIGAFLRHEMGKKRPEEGDPQAGAADAPPVSGQDADGGRAGAGSPAGIADEN
jgi:hypothetical protein